MTLPGRIAYTALVAFVVSMLTLLAVDWLGPDTGPVPATARVDKQPTIRTVTAEEVARHDQPGACWMATHGQVYDFTDYLPRHPTPEHILHPYCGTDASVGWDTRGVGRPHSPRALDLLPAYAIGTLASGNGG